jgi:hypothetical protein
MSFTPYSVSRILYPVLNLAESSLYMYCLLAGSPRNPLSHAVLLYNYPETIWLAQNSFMVLRFVESNPRAAIHTQS